MQAGEQLCEQVLPAGLVFRGGVVVLGLQGGPELDAGLEEVQFSQTDSKCSPVAVAGRSSRCRASGSGRGVAGPCSRRSRWLQSGVHPEPRCPQPGPRRLLPTRLRMNAMTRIAEDAAGGLGASTAQT